MTFDKFLIDKVLPPLTLEDPVVTLNGPVDFVNLCVDAIINIASYKNNGKRNFADITWTITTDYKD